MIVHNVRVRDIAVYNVHIRDIVVYNVFSRAITIYSVGNMVSDAGPTVKIWTPIYTCLLLHLAAINEGNIHINAYSRPYHIQIYKQNSVNFCKFMYVLYKLTSAFMFSIVFIISTFLN